MRLYIYPSSVSLLQVWKIALRHLWIQARHRGRPVAVLFYDFHTWKLQWWCRRAESGAPDNLAVASVIRGEPGSPMGCSSQPDI